MAMKLSIAFHGHDLCMIDRAYYDAATDNWLTCCLQHINDSIQAIESM
jgi:predicted HD phosphohydrolase